MKPNDFILGACICQMLLPQASRFELVQATGMALTQIDTRHPISSFRGIGAEEESQDHD
jgi:hypothetical protein